MTTIILLLSRKFLIKELAEYLEQNDCDRTQTNLLVMVDGEGKLYNLAQKYFGKQNYNIVKIHWVKDHHEVNRSRVYRRRRIVELHNYAKEQLPECEFVLLIEDDGIPPKDGFKTLLKRFKEKSDVGFIEGLQLGRWQSRYIGAWKVDNPFHLTEIKSIEYKPNKLIEIDAGGFYFMLTKTEYYLWHKHFTNANYGPDIVYGLQLRKRNLKNYIDTSVEIPHYTENGEVFSIKYDTPRVICLRKERGAWRFIHSVQKA